MAVQHIIDKVGLHAEKVTLGEVLVREDNLPVSTIANLDNELQTLGFERIDDRRSRIIEGIKKKIINLIHHRDRVSMKHNWSDVLAEELNHEYNYLSNLFSSVEGITIEQYIIRQKIERSKELLFYDELTLSEIADKLGYSSVAHLSAQFKKVTGLTPSELKKSHAINNSRKPLDAVE
jgi:AraC family transcriptional regulator